MTEVAPTPLLVRHERLWRVVLVSLAVHVALLALAMRHRPEPRIDLAQKPIVAKLVRLGQKRPEHFLPRKDQPPAPPPAAAVPVPVASPAPAPVPTVASPKVTAPQPRPPARPAAASGGGRDVLASVLSKVKRDRAREEPVYGDPNGDPRGEASDASEGDQYLALVRRALGDTYTLFPVTLSDAERLHIRATVVLYIDGDGRLLRYAFENRSGNASFDSALERAVRAARLPPPPDRYRQKFREEGLEVTYTPSS